MGCGSGSAESGAPFAGRGSFPGLEGTEKGIRILIAEQEGDAGELHLAMLEIVAGEFLARVFDQLLERESRFAEPALECAGAHAELARDILQGGAAASK